jgi:ABC-type polar amino acid transport system ATPase subunit
MSDTTPPDPAVPRAATISAGNGPAPTDRILLEARDIRKRFGDTEILKSVSLAVHEREVVVIIGPSGCGKSTFLRCLNALERYEGGEVILDGSTVSRGRLPHERVDRDAEQLIQALRRRVGMVFQQFNLFLHMDVWRNVTAGPTIVQGKSRAEADAAAEQALRKVGMLDRAHALPCELSGGQQQRVAIARSLAMDPDMVLFDEPTSALDPKLTKEVFRVIRDLAYEGMTMALVTHDMDFARDVADRIVYFHDGHINAQGTAEQILDAQPTPELQAFLCDD